MSKQNHNPLYVPKKLAAAALGMSQQNFDIRIRNRLLPESVVGEGKSLRFNLAAVVQAYVEQRQELASVDPLLAGNESPALERYRLARAALAENDLRKQNGELVSAEQTQQWLVRNLQSARNNLLGMAARIVPYLQGRNAAEQQGVIENAVRESLEAVATMDVGEVQ